MQVMRTSKFQDDYEMKEEIAKGAYATCRRCVHKSSRVEHAVKVCLSIFTNFSFYCD